MLLTPIVLLLGIVSPGLAATVNSLAKRATKIDIGYIEAAEIDGDYFVNIAWRDGISPCNGKALSQDPFNPCGVEFCLDDGECGFTWEGCGGPTWINKNGKFYANCHTSGSYCTSCNGGTFFGTACQNYYCQ